MNQEEIIFYLTNLIKDYGIKGSFIATELSISYTFLKQVLNRERKFSNLTLEKAEKLLRKYSNIIAQ